MSLFLYSTLNYPDWDFDDWGNQITDNIYLGSAEAALVPLQQLKARNITHILMVGTELDAQYPKDLKYLHIKIEDGPGANIKQYFTPCIEFIHGAVEKKENVLIHCLAGFSRSPTIVAAWIMASEGIDSDAAISKILKKRRVSPNTGFRIQLQEFETSQMVKTKVTVTSTTTADINLNSSSSSSASSSLDSTIITSVISAKIENLKL